MDHISRTIRPHTPSGPGRVSGGWLARRLLPVVLLALPVAGWAITHSMLLGDPNMNAKRFANYFGDFRFEYHEEIQPVDYFLDSQRGDCDDYAVLADEVLRHRRFATTLVHIRLAGMVAHAVCYVTDDRGYLDYNNRKVFFTLSRCRPSLREIAEKVADSLEANWTSVSAFTYSYATGQKQMIRTIAKVDPPGPDDLPVKAPGSRLLVE